MLKNTSFVILSLLVLIFRVSSLKAEILYAQDEALKRAFPAATKVVKRVFILTPSKAEKLKFEHSVQISSQMVTYFAGYDRKNFLGFAVIDTGVVRTHQGVFMSVFKPDQELLDVFVLAFHEPSEYIPTKSWLNQFKGKKIKDPLSVGHDISGVMGSTLSVQAISQSVRRIRTLIPFFRS
jgi:hypothetical protein